MKISDAIQNKLVNLPVPQNALEWHEYEKDLAAAERLIAKSRYDAHDKWLAAGQKEYGTLDYHLERIAKGKFDFDIPLQILLDVIDDPGEYVEKDFTLEAIPQVSGLVTVRIIFAKKSLYPDPYKITVLTNSVLLPSRQGYVKRKFKVIDFLDDAAFLKAKVDEQLRKAISDSSKALIQAKEN